MVFMRSYHSSGMMPTIAATARAIRSKVPILFRLFSQNMVPMTAIPTKAPRDWLPMAAMAVNIIAATKPCLTKCRVA